MNTIRFAIVGFGNIAKTHMTALRALPIVKKLPAAPLLDTLVTRDPAKAAQQAAAIGFRRVAASAAEAAEDAMVDVLDVCTPNARHYEDAEAAFRYHKSVYLEKPLTETYERSESLVREASRRKGLTLQLAFTFRYQDRKSVV